MTEPYDVVIALRALRFETDGESVAWMDQPNADLDGKPVGLTVLHGEYDDAIRAITLEAGRRNLRRYHPGLVEDD